MSKRNAEKDLNHDNWHEEDPDEPIGTFQRASEEEMKKRTIKRATRRLDAGGEAKSSVFGGFAGFGKPPSTQAGQVFAGLSFGGASTAAISNNNNNAVAKPANGGTGSSYSADLKALNQAVVKWIKECVDKNPICNLTPIFNDYQKYFKDLEAEKNGSSSESKATAPSSSPFSSYTMPPKESLGSFQFKSSSSTLKADDKQAPPKSDEKPKFNLGAFKVDPPKLPFSDDKPKAEPAKPAASTFSFGSAASSSAPTFTGFGNAGKTFSFGQNAAPFTFQNVSQAPKPVEEAAKEEENEDEDEPPKVEFTPVVEEDSVYSKKCKVFVKDGDFKDRGVGTLFVKEVEDGQKTQLLVRADTSLGNLLLNTLLTESMPLKRMGKNNVMLATAVDGKPTTVLLRVKTSEDADELLAELEKYKK